MEHKGESRGSLLLAGVLGEPIEAVVQTVAREGAGALDVPFSALDSVQGEFLGDFGDTHDTLVLFVGEDQDDGVSEFLLSKHPVEFLLGEVNTVFVRGVNDENQSLSVLVVVSPQKSDFVLSPNVPDGEFDFLVFESFDVESNRGNR